MNYQRIKEKFLEKYNCFPSIAVQSPGRINIIGEHTDYNDGFVLPASINYHMFIGFSKNNSDAINLYSIDYDEFISQENTDVSRTDSDWLNLINGVIYQLKEKIGGFDLAFGGNVPEGAGVSSSAALCCGVAFGLSELFELKLSKWELAKIAQKSEHDFALVQCGIMDQFACLFGQKDHVLLLNCLNLNYKQTLIDLSGFKFLLINSNVKHNLGDSDYNRRREESAEAIAFFKFKYENIKSYQDINLELLEGHKVDLNAVLYKRAHHIVSENIRVQEINEGLKSNDVVKVGKLLTEGHLSLKDDYQITCEETDFLVDEFILQENVLGARQVGGGFGGCVLALVEDKDSSIMIEGLNNRYRKNFDLTLDNIPIRISDGCRLLT